MLPALVLGALISDAAAQGFTLERVVLVSRHGVRAPTDSPALVEFSRSRTWPKWPVSDAYLTLRGKMLASRMGEYYAAEFAARGLSGGRVTDRETGLRLGGCRSAHQTGAGLLEGIFACQDDCQIRAATTATTMRCFIPSRVAFTTPDHDRAQQRSSSGRRSD
jgi:hypothetical protein